MAHGHADLSRGGAEQAAYDEFAALSARPDIEAHLLARAPLDRGHGGTPFSLHRAPNEVLFHSDMPDLLRLSQPIKQMVWSGFRDYLLRLKPDVVHFHHYVFLGVELISEVRRTLPQAKIVLTLHEFWAMCHREGLMVRTSDGGLCEEAKPERCHECFPTVSPEDFLLRKQFIQAHLRSVDQFVTPSDFLRQRYIDWGLPAEQITTVENGQAQHWVPLANGDARSLHRRFAFFGQVNRWKGLDLLLDAMSLLGATAHGPRAEQPPLEATLDVYGANLEHQAPEVRERILAKLQSVSANVRFHGAYRKADLPSLMAGIGWVVVPSIWWENSPLVIQEAFSLGRPVICADIGGMAEKVRHGQDGLHFRARSAQSLADALGAALADPGLWQRLAKGIRQPPRVEDQIERVLDLTRSAPRPGESAV